LSSYELTFVMNFVSHFLIKLIELKVTNFASDLCFLRFWIFGRNIFRTWVRCSYIETSINSFTWKRAFSLSQQTGSIEIYPKRHHKAIRYKYIYIYVYYIFVTILMTPQPHIHIIKNFLLNPFSDPSVARSLRSQRLSYFPKCLQF